MSIGPQKHYSSEHSILNGQSVIIMLNGFMEESKEMNFGVFSQQPLGSLHYLDKIEKIG